MTRIELLKEVMSEMKFTKDQIKSTLRAFNEPEANLEIPPESLDQCREELTLILTPYRMAFSIAKSLGMKLAGIRKVDAANECPCPRCQARRATEQSFLA